MAEIPISVVRHSESQAKEFLEYYLFSNPYVRLRTPRGIASNQVSKFLLLALKPNTSAFSCERAVQAMRFYEVSDLTVHLRSLLTGHERSDEDIRRSAFFLQALADLGTSSDAAWAASYFDRILLAKDGFAAEASLLLDTLLVLAPSGSPNAFVERLRSELALVRSPQIRGDLQEMWNSRVPGLAYQAAGKYRVMTALPGRRAAELISIYLVESDLSQPYLVTWAARVIRRDAMQDDPTGIYAHFGKAIDSQSIAAEEDSEAEFTIVRAAQAILYLKGTLTPYRAKKYDASHPENFANFLWDDWSVSRDE